MQAEPQSPQTSIGDIGEFGLIGHLRSVLGDADDESVVRGIADDAAVYRVHNERVHVMTTDALIEGIHFDRAFMPLEHLGFKAISVNVSDITAMNATPRYATVVLGLPQNMTVEMAQTLYEGVRQACTAYGVTVVGGDTTGAHGLTLSVTVVGEADEDEIVYRGGAQVGDALCVTGDLGAAYAGLKVLLQERERLQSEGEGFQPNLDPFSYVIRRQLAPPAQLKVVEGWKEAGVKPNALIDISDGLSSEVHHIAEASGVGVRLFGPALPIAVETRNAASHFGEDVDTFALFGGEDYELLFTLPNDRLDQLDPQSFNVIGEVVDQDFGVTIEQPDGKQVPLRPGGFDHFEGQGDEA